MPPVVGIHVDQENTMNDDDLYFEASILHRIPTKLTMPISASSIITSDATFEQQQLASTDASAAASGQSRRSLLLKRKKIHDGRLRKLAKFQAELRGTKEIQLSQDESEDAEEDDRIDSDSDDDSNENQQPDRLRRNEIMRKKELLINVILRTMVLIHYNREFQNNVTALQMETRKYVQSYRDNHKNRNENNNDNNNHIRRDNADSSDVMNNQ